MGQLRLPLFLAPVEVFEKITVAFSPSVAFVCIITFTREAIRREF